MDPEVTIIVPCLNEAQNITALVARLKRVLEYYGLSGEIFIVDDCSDDYTFKEALILEQSCPLVKALHKGLPRGIGGTIQYGIQHARGEVGVVAMGDGVDPLTVIPEFRRKIIEEGYDLVLLSRYLVRGDSGTIPLSYRFYHRLYRMLCRYLIGIRLRDITYAFRGFRISYIKGLGLESNGFEISPEITIKTYLNGGRICEIPGRQGRRLLGESKFIFSKEGIGYGRVLIKGIVARITRKWI